MSNDKENLFMQYSQNPVNIGRMNDPSGAGWIKGMCGDTMEIYLVIESNIISDAKFFTDGCCYTLACGSVTTDMAKGRGIYDALRISPGEIIDKLGDLPVDHHHCAVLAVSTLYQAVVDYMLRKWGDERMS